jgi:hypothetical protein
MAGPDDKIPKINPAEVELLIQKFERNNWRSKIRERSPDSCKPRSLWWICCRTRSSRSCG